MFTQIIVVLARGGRESKDEMVVEVCVTSIERSIYFYIVCFPWHVVVWEVHVEHFLEIIVNIP